MSFDGLALKRIIEELNTVLIQGRIDKIYQLEDFSFLFYVRRRQRQQLIISASKHQTRMHLSNYRYEKPMNPPLFCMLLRKHLESAYIIDIKQKDNDRVVTFTFRSRNELGDPVKRYLIFEALGKDANLILTDEKYKILDALNHTHPFDEVQRTMIPSAQYSYPEDTRINPFDQETRDAFFKTKTITDAKMLLTHFQGIAPQFAKEFIYRKNKDQSGLMQTMSEENTPQIIETKKMAFSVYDLTHLQGEKHIYHSPSEMLDKFYTLKDSKEKFQQRHKDLKQLIAKNLKKQTRKIEQLNQDLKKAENCDIYKNKGNLILANQQQIKTGDDQLNAYDYEHETTLEIALDRHLSAIENAQSYFKRYKKLKKSKPHIKREIIKAKNERTYFRLLESQLQDANLSDLEEIREELSQYGYIKANKRNKKLSKKANYLTYQDREGIAILVGKNNIQNAQITHKEARPHHVWFHVQGAPGSHVVVKESLEHLLETTIRFAAQLAAYHSKMRYSSSVPVDYTQVKYVKKIPGQKPCFVKYSKQKTIYIDPDETFIKHLTSD